MIPSTRLLILGDPSSRRVGLAAEAARRVGLQWPVIVSYLDFLARPQSLARALSPGTILRIEAPSDDLRITQALLRRGFAARAEESREPLPPQAIESLEYARGEIVAPRQWYLGLAALMEELASLSASIGGIRTMASPGEIPVLCDKSRSQARWKAAGVPVPRFWQGIRSYDELRGMDLPRRLFIKMNHGYSAMGAMAIEFCGERVRAITATERLVAGGTPRLFVSKRIRVLLAEQEIARLFDSVAASGVIVEEWLPKSRWNGKAFDVRVVTISGEPRHIVGRANNIPFTNLNLDASRIDAQTLQITLGSSWEALLETAARAAQLFPESLYLGLDLLPLPKSCQPSREKFVVLEGNAWGDYLPGLVDAGEDVYEAELRAMLSERRERSREEASCIAS